MGIAALNPSYLAAADEAPVRGAQRTPRGGLIVVSMRNAKTEPKGSVFVYAVGRVD